jgi:eukaryotic-like serine/threonine-protein kinase
MLVGTKVGRFIIKQKIGAGGMGEVYLADDESLNREMVVKVLLPEFCCNTDRVNRFKLEARATSSLNHPNIITIYEIGQHDEQLFIATEYIKGETLRSLIERKAISFGSALHIAEQITSGMTAAHNAGIIHRDLKPENIMVREDGIVKVLDFGLAKPTLVESEAETRELVSTKAGMVMGSVSYMSPEQSRGKEVDTRSDLWSIGVVLYEMLAEKTPFEGETMTDILANIIYKEPLPITEILEDAPHELQRILKKSLRKDREERYQSAKDLLLDVKNLRRELELEHELEVSVSPTRLNEIRSRTNDRITGRNLLKPTNEAMDTQILASKTVSHSVSENPVTPVKKRYSMVLAAFIGLLLLGTLSVLSFYLWQGPMQVNAFENPQISTISKINNTGEVKISPDGKYLVYVQSSSEKKPHLMLRQIETGSEKDIAPIEDNQIGLIRFSLDANYVYFTMQPKGALGFNLYRVPTLGGELRQIASDVDSGVSFRPDGKSLIFHRHVINPPLDKIIEIKAEGGEEKELFSSEKLVFNPQISPDGKIIAALSADKSIQLGKPSAFFVTMPASGGELTQIGKFWGSANEFSWIKDGSGLVVSGFYEEEEDSKVYVLSFPEGEVKQITKDTNSYYGASVTADGNTVATIQSNLVAGIWEWEIASGKARQISPNDKDRLGTEGLSVAPNGKIIYTKPINKDESELWEMDVVNNVAKILTAKNSGRNFYPIVSADGSFIFYQNFRNGVYDVWRMNLDGSNPIQITKTPDLIETIGGISPDNKTVVFSQVSKDVNIPAIMEINVENSETSPILQDTKQYPNSVRLSPDGKNLLYINAPIQFENGVIPQSSLYIAPFDGKKIGQPKQILKTLNSNQYKWSADGKFLYYAESSSNNSDIWKLNLVDGKTSKITNFNLEKIIRFAVSPEGKRFYLVRGSSAQDIVLIKAGKK